MHRDIKPENLFITTDGRLKILDFGLARSMDPLDERTATITLDGGQGAILDTAGDVSTEQLRGVQTDHRSDIFSLGVVLYEMLARTLSALLYPDAQGFSALAHGRPDLRCYCKG